MSFCFYAIKKNITFTELPFFFTSIIIIEFTYICHPRSSFLLFLCSCCLLREYPSMLLAFSLSSYRTSQDHSNTVIHYFPTNPPILKKKSNRYYFPLNLFIFHLPYLSSTSSHQPRPRARVPYPCMMRLRHGRMR